MVGTPLHSWMNPNVIQGKGSGTCIEVNWRNKKLSILLYSYLWDPLDTTDTDQSLCTACKYSIGLLAPQRKIRVERKFLRPSSLRLPHGGLAQTTFRTWQRNKKKRRESPKWRQSTWTFLMLHQENAFSLRFFFFCIFLLESTQTL